MAVFQVSSRTMPMSAPSKKRPHHLRQEWSTILRFIIAVSGAGGLFGLLVIFKGSNDILFIFLPVFVYLAIVQFQRFNLKYPSFVLNMLLDGTPAYLLLTICLAFVYYGAVTAGELLTHQEPTVSHMILVTTTLAWATIFDPVRAAVQQWIERRFNRRDQDVLNAIEKFTATLREEIDIDQLRERFLGVIQQTLQPYSVSLWVRNFSEQAPSSALREEAVLADDDPLFAYIMRHPAVLDLDRLSLESQAVQEMRQRATELLLPLASQGELVGLLLLGLRVNGEPYTDRDRTMLNTLAPQVAPALRVAQMVQAQQEQVRENERIEQELRTAQAIQHAFLPEALPLLAGWQLATHYQPAREVGGDFYDFIPFDDGRLGLVIGDATDKGMPAALVMTTTCTMLRTVAQTIPSPAEALARVNDLLYARIPPRMFVTCFYALLDPKSGQLCYANAGQDLPFHRQHNHVSELWARGMPLGMLPGSTYEEHELTIAPGEQLLFYSDGLTEAHNPQKEMFDTNRIKAILEKQVVGASLIEAVLDELKRFAGQNWEQEDDVTLLTLQRSPLSPTQDEEQSALVFLGEMTLASVADNEQQAAAWITDVVAPLHLPTELLNNLKTAVAEAVMNAMEHGNHYAPDKGVLLQVLASNHTLLVRVRDQGDGKQHPILDPGAPDLEAKLSGQESARGWGLFLIKNLVDALHIINDEHFHCLEMVIHREKQRD